MTYRTKEEVDLFREQDPIYAYGRYIIDNGLVTEEELEGIDVAIKEKMRRARDHR